MTLYQLFELEQGDRVAQAMGLEYISKAARMPPHVLDHIEDPQYPFAPR